MSHAALTPEEKHFLDGMRTVHLATSDTDGNPHVVPIVFAIDNHRLYTPIDRKPKRVRPRELRRARNLLANPQVAIVGDAYAEDWTRLGWVLLRGTGEIIESGEAHAAGVRLLHAKYPQYERMPLDTCPLIVVNIDSVSSWGRLDTKHHPSTRPLKDSNCV